MNQSVDAIRRYNAAFHSVYGRLPDLRNNHGWIRINGGPKSYRPWQIRDMADDLARRARYLNEQTEPEANRIIAELAHEREREREHTDERAEMIKRIRMQLEERERDVWDVSKELNTHVQKQIKKEAEKVFIDQKQTHVNIEGWRKHVSKDVLIMFLNKLFERAGFSAFTMQRMMDIFISNGNFGDETNCEECESAMEAEIIKERNNDLNENISIIRHKLRERNNVIDDLKKQLERSRKNQEELKKNSVVFSMDFMEKEPLITYRDEEDDIPF